MISLARLVEDFAAAIQRADSRRPQAAGSRTGRVYQPGIGPHTESQTIRLVTGELVALDHAYAAHALDVPYPRCVTAAVRLVPGLGPVLGLGSRGEDAPSARG